MVFSVDEQKKNVAREAIKLVQPGMVLGLGTGTTAAHFIRFLGERAASENHRYRCIATSVESEALARSLGLDVAFSIKKINGRIDLAVDGADEINPYLCLIKGGGAALLREKIVAQFAQKFVVIAEEKKWVKKLGRFPLPVEVTPFANELTKETICRQLLAHRFAMPKQMKWRKSNGQLIFTDEGNYLLDVCFDRIDDPTRLAKILDQIPGVVDHGLFIHEADIVLIGQENGVARYDRSDLL